MKKFSAKIQNDAIFGVNTRLLRVARNCYYFFRRLHYVAIFILVPAAILPLLYHSAR